MISQLTDVAMITAAVTTTAAALYRTAQVHARGRLPADVALITGLLALSVAALTYAPAVVSRLDAAVHGVSAAEAAGQVAVLVAGWRAQSILLYYTGGDATTPQVHRGGQILLAVLVGMGALFAAAHGHIATTTTAPVTPPPGPITGYWLLLAGTLCWQLADSIRMCLHCARLAPTEWLGVGLLIVAGGCALGIITFLLFASYGWFQAAGAGSLTELDTAGRATAVVSVSLIALGATLPGWGSSLARAPGDAWRSWRSYRRLRPLWRSLCAACPGIALGQRGWNVELRLYRRVIEIRDGLLTAASSSDPATPLHAVQEAQRRVGAERTDPDGDDGSTIAVARQHPSPPLPTAGDRDVGRDLQAEVAELERLAWHFRELSKGGVDAA